MVHVSGAICWASVLARQTQRSAHPPAAPPGDRDSRIDAIFSDPSVKRNLDARSPLNWANALLGGRFDILQTYGVSGDRTDQMMSRLATAIATGAGLLYLQCGLNDVGNNYPTATTSGATAAANIAAMCETATTAGMIVVLEIEV